MTSCASKLRYGIRSSEWLLVLTVFGAFYTTLTTVARSMVRGITLSQLEQGASRDPNFNPMRR
jgi:hypothetical protein